MEEWSPFRAYGPKYGAFCSANVITFLLLGSGAIWYYLQARHLPAYKWNWPALGEFIVLQSPDGNWKPGLLLQGLFTTIRVGFWTFLVSFFLGLMFGIYAVKKSFLKSLPYQFFINLVRNTPPIIIIFCVYFLIGNVAPLTKLMDAIREWPPICQKIIAVLFAPAGQMESMVAAVIALGIYQSAYVAEIIRGSIESVPQEQWNAGAALGFNKFSVIRLIILPQGLRLALPPLTGQCISTFKDSSLASLISLPDMTFQSLEIMAISGMTFEIWISTGMLYLALGIICSLTGRLLELHYSYR